MSDKFYNVVKWVSMILVPALIGFLSVVLPAVGVDPELTNTIDVCIGAFGTLLGALIGISTVQYNKNKGE